jgi:integrase
MYYDWITKCLTEDNLLEELLFVRLSVELMIRSREIVLLKSEQFNLKNCIVSNIKISKVNPDHPEVIKYYEDRQISTETFRLFLRHIQENNIETGKLFNSNVYKYAENIKKSIGNGRFGLHDLRTIGLVLNWQ